MYMCVLFMCTVYKNTDTCIYLSNVYKYMYIDI